MADESNNLLNRAVGEAKTISSEISDYTKQRFSHPLFFSLIISFVLYNWRPISIFIFSKQPIENVIEHLYTYDNQWAVFSPIIAAILYTLLFPFLRNGIGWLLKWATDHDDRMRHKRNIGLAVFKEEEAAYEYKIATRRSGTNEITAMQTVIEEKEALISSLKSSINAATERSLDLEEQTRRMEERLMQNYLIKIEQQEKEAKTLKGEAEELEALLSKFNAILDHTQKFHPNSPFNVIELIATVEILNTDEKEWVKKTIKRKVFKGVIPIRTSVLHVLVQQDFFLKTNLGLVKTPKFQSIIDKLREQDLWNSVNA